MTELCQLAEQYGTDKCPQIKHHYTLYYDGLFDERRNDIKKVVEIGIGLFPTTKNIVGPSLRMWRDYFPNAMVYGADIDPTLMFEEERIKTYVCDQTKAEHLYRLVATIGTDIDLFVDDGTHMPDDQIFTCKIILPMLPNESYYIIEDVNHRARERIFDTLSASFDCELWRPRWSKYKDDCLLIARRKA